MSQPKGYDSKWNANNLRSAINNIYSDAQGCATDAEALTMFERSGRYDCCILIPYLDPQFKILDFAGGIGRVAKHAILYVHGVTVIDYSEDMIRLGKEYCKDYPVIEFIKNTNNIPLEDNTFDLTYSFLCACHLMHESHDFEYWLSEMVRVTKPGGYIIIDTEQEYVIQPPLGSSLFEFYRKYQILSEYNTMIYVLKKGDQ